MKLVMKVNQVFKKGKPSGEEPYKEKGKTIWNIIVADGVFRYMMQQREMVIEEMSQKTKVDYMEVPVWKDITDTHSYTPKEGLTEKPKKRASRKKVEAPKEEQTNNEE